MGRPADTYKQEESLELRDNGNTFCLISQMRSIKDCSMPGCVFKLYDMMMYSEQTSYAGGRDDHLSSI